MAPFSNREKIILEVPASRDWFLDLYVFVWTEQRPETVNRQDASELTALKSSSEGAGTPRPLRFRVDLEIYALAGDCCDLKHTRWQGWQTSPLRISKGDGHCKMRCQPLYLEGGTPQWPEPLGVRASFPQPS